MDLNGAVVHGMVDVTEAHVTGSLDLAGAILSRPQARRCVRATGASISGTFGLARARARVTGGALRFRNASIGGVVDAEGACVVNPGETTLNLHQTRIGGNVRLNGGFTSVGLLVLNRCDVAGRLRGDGGTFTWLCREPETLAVWTGDVPYGPEPNERGSAVEAISVSFRSGITLGWSVPSGGVDLIDARTTFLADDPDRDWPRAAHLTGFTYERYAPVTMTGGDGVWAARERIAWLARTSPSDRNPWEHAAAVLRANGDGYGVGFRVRLHSLPSSPAQGR